jgi:hypothetical protein
MKDTKIYNLKTKSGDWLGQIVLTTNGSFLSITDYGNFNYNFGSFGDVDFRKFILGLELSYFASKMYQGISYISHGKKFQESANLFAEKILIRLQEAIQKELDEEQIN